MKTNADKEQVDITLGKLIIGCIICIATVLCITINTQQDRSIPIVEAEEEVEVEPESLTFEDVSNDIYVTNLDGFAVLSYHAATCPMVGADGERLVYTDTLDLEFMELGESESGALFYYIVDNSNGVYYVLTIYETEVSIVRV